MKFWICHFPDKMATTNSIQPARSTSLTGMQPSFQARKKECLVVSLLPHPSLALRQMTKVLVMLEVLTA